MNIQVKKWEDGWWFIHNPCSPLDLKFLHRDKKWHKNTSSEKFLPSKYNEENWPGYWDTENEAKEFLKNYLDELTPEEFAQLCAERLTA